MMRAHLKSVAVLAALVLVSLLVLRHRVGEGEPVTRKPLSAEEIDAVMARADYRRVGVRAHFLNTVLGIDTAYAYQGSMDVIVPRYPMVALSGTIPVYVMFRIRQYGKSCFSKLKVGTPITDAEWLSDAREVFGTDEPQWDPTMFDDPARLPYVTPIVPSGPGNDRGGGGWQCTPGVFH